MGIGYHLLFFTRINTLAYAFGLLFVAQAALLFADGFIRRQITFRAERRLANAGSLGHSLRMDWSSIR